jgi:hypothetical protein
MRVSVGQGGGKNPNQRKKGTYYMKTNVDLCHGAPVVTLDNQEHAKQLHAAYMALLTEIEHGLTRNVPRSSMLDMVRRERREIMNLAMVGERRPENTLRVW